MTAAKLGVGDRRALWVVLADTPGQTVKLLKRPERQAAMLMRSSKRCPRRPLNAFGSNLWSRCFSNAHGPMTEPSRRFHRLGMPTPCPAAMSSGTPTGKGSAIRLRPAGGAGDPFSAGVSCHRRRGSEAGTLASRLDSIAPMDDASTIAAQLDVPERVLLFCLASGTEWAQAGVTGATTTMMLVRGLVGATSPAGSR
jgi:hypothetical protein